MDKSKLLEFFDATKVNRNVHVVGCGAIGSHVCEQLARMGFEEVHIYDFDTVSPHNITNQMFYHCDIGAPKTHMCYNEMRRINPDMKVIMHEKGLQDPYILNGIIILCVDDIELRKKIVEANRYNPHCYAFLDFRMRLTDAQHYAAHKNNAHEMNTLLSSMDFTNEEAKEATPLSACGVELSVVYTVKTIVSLGMANLVKILTEADDYKTMILCDLNQFTIDAFKCTQIQRKH